MTIKTVSVTDVTEVDFNSDGTNSDFFIREKFCWIKNKSDSAMYVSLDENCIADADGTAQISSGECGMIILSTENKIYLSGSGDAEIKTSDFAECPFKIASKGGGSGGSSVNIVDSPTAEEIAASVAEIWGE